MRHAALLACLSLLFVVPTAAQDCTHYLSASDGDDSNTGTSPGQAMRSFERAFTQFPDEAVVCMFAGEYFYGADADGIQLAGDEVDGKNMTFAIQPFAGESDVRFSEASFVLDVGTGSLSFVSSGDEQLIFGIGLRNSPVEFPNNQSFLHTLALESGMFDVASVDVLLEPSVGNPSFVRTVDGTSVSAPDSAAILRTAGRIQGELTFEAGPRTIIYRGSSDRTAGPELPSVVANGRIAFELAGGSVTVDEAVTISDGTQFVLSGAGTAVIASEPVVHTDGGTRILNTGPGRLAFPSGLMVHVAGDAGVVVDNQNGGSLEIDRLSMAPTDASASMGVSNSGSLHLAELEQSAAGAIVELDIVNSGQLRLGATGVLFAAAGSLTNSGTAHLDGDVTFSGLIENDALVDLGAHTMTLSADVQVDNSGEIAHDAGASDGIVIRGATVLSGSGTWPTLLVAEGSGTLTDGVKTSDVEISSGASLAVNDTVSVGGHLTAAAEALIDLPGILCIEGDFSSTGASVQGTGTLCFDGGKAQTLDPGETLDIPNLRISGAGTSLLLTGPVRARGDVEIQSQADLQLGMHSLSLIGDGARFSLLGTYESEPEGEVVFSDPDADANQQAIEGTGVFGNVRIDLSSADDVVDLTAPTFTQSGTLHCARGGLNLNGANVVLDADIQFPQLRLNASAVPEGGCIVGGQFNSNNHLFDLEYYGELDGDYETGPEFISRLVRHLDIRTQGAVLLDDEKGVFGSVHVAAGAVLKLNDAPLLSLGDHFSHDVDGRLEQGPFVVNGADGTVTSQAGTGSIDSLVVDGSDISVDGLNYIRSLVVLDGLVELDFAFPDSTSFDSASPDSAASIGTLTQHGGTVRLQSSLAIDSMLAVDAGRFRLGGNSVYLFDDASIQAMPSADGTSRIEPETTDFMEGFIVFSGGDHVIIDSSHSSLLARVRIDTDAGGSVQLGTDLVVTEILDQRAGLLDLNGSNLVLSSTTWQFSDGAVSDDGHVIVNGSSGLQMRNNFAVPSLRLDAGSDLRIQSQPGENYALTVTEALRLDGGALDMSKNDVRLVGSDSAFIYDAGAISSSGGDLVFAGDEDQTMTVTGALTIPSLRIENDVRVEGAEDLTISSRIALGHGGSTLRFSDAEADLVIRPGVTIVRTGPGDFARTPIFPTNGTVNLSYRAPVATGSEVPPNDPVNTLTVDLEGDVDLTRSIDVASRLHLDRGNIRTTSTHTIHVADGSTVTRARGSINASGEGSNLSGGAYTLVYNNVNGPVFTADGEFPSTAKITLLRVSGNARTSLHAGRSVDSLVVAKADSAAAFDLNARTLRTLGGMRVERGSVTSHIGAATLISEGVVLVGAAGSIANAAGLPAPGIVSMVADDRMIVEGSFSGSELFLEGNLDVSGEIGPSTHLHFDGTAQTFTYNSADADPNTVDLEIEELTLEQSGPTASLLFRSDNATPFLVRADRLHLSGGLLLTGDHGLRLSCSANAVSRSASDAAPSHVVGSIERLLTGNQCDGLLFPTGSAHPAARYRPMELLLGTELAIPADAVLRVRHVDAPPGGTVGFPIDGDGSEIRGTAPFSWLVEPTPGLDNLQLASLRIVGSDLSADPETLSAMRIITRGLARSDPWSLVGTSVSYDVALSEDIGLVVDASGVALSPGGEPLVLTMGLPQGVANFPQIQFVHNVTGIESLGVVFADDTLAVGLSRGNGTPYASVPEGTHELVLIDGEAVAFRDDVTLDADENYLIVGVAADGDIALDIMPDAVTGANIHSDSVHVAFYHGVADVDAVSVFRRPENLLLFDSILFREFSDQYVHLSAGLFSSFVARSDGSGEDIHSSRIDFSGEGGSAFLGMLARDEMGNMRVQYVRDDGTVLHSIIDVAAEDEPALPSRLKIYGNYPNPFATNTSIDFDLPQDAEVSVEVYDILGRIVKRLPARRISGGARRTLELRADEMASGRYLYRLVAVSPNSTATETGNLVVVK